MWRKYSVGLRFILLFACLSLAVLCSAQAEPLLLPQGLTVIEAEAFMGCTQFTGTLSIPPTVKRIGAHAFDGCTGLTGIVYVSDETIVDNTAFDNTSLTVVTGYPKTVLKYIETSGTDTISGHTAYAFKEKLEQLSDYTIIVEIISDTGLPVSTITDHFLSNSNQYDLASISPSALSVYALQYMDLLETPFLFSSVDHFKAFAASDLAKEALMEPLYVGFPFHGLCFGFAGFANTYLKNTTSGLTDITRRKISTASSSNRVQMYISLGANPTVVSDTEEYAALQTGVTNGIDTTYEVYQSLQLHKVAPFVLEDRHRAEIFELIVSTSAWEKLNAQQQSWVTQASVYAQNKSFELAETVRANALTQGVTLIAGDTTYGRNACAALIQSLTNNLEEEYNLILKME